MKLEDMEAETSNDPFFATKHIYFKDVIKNLVGKNVVVDVNERSYYGTLEEFNGSILHLKYHTTYDTINEYYIKSEKVSAITLQE